jgi:two-component system NtrC family sensor kinase
MRVRAKVTLLLALLFAVLIGAQWAIQQLLVLPRFEELERAAARTDMQRVELAIERELQNLAAGAGDWGNWADTWRYMSRPNREFEQANLNDTALRTLRVDYIALVASDGHFVWTGGLDPLSGERLQIRLNHDNQLEPAWGRALERGVPASGLIDTSAGVMLASGSPILDGFSHGPSRGMVIVGRLFDEAEKTRIANQAQVALKLSRWRLQPDGQQESGDDTRLRATATTIEVEHVLRNLSGRPLLVAGIAMPRTISGQGAQAVHYSTLSVSVAAAVVLAALIYLIGRIVLGPLGVVTDHAQRFAAADDLSARLDSTRRDELGTLAASIDNMVERLAQSRRELIDRSFESGAAENASGILHELGNALTPLAVHADMAAAQVAAMPVDDLQRGVGELYADAPEAQRQQDLRSYLQLVAGEFARLHARAGESLRALLGQVQAIGATLEAQRRRPRAGAVMQSMAPAELVTRGLERLTALQRSRLEIEMSPGLAALGALTLPCTTLAMVLQKLSQYAADAAQRGGLARARLRVSAFYRGGDGAGTLRLIVEANVGGIAPAGLPGLFRMPFAVESTAAAAAADLHWCANTLHALGGGITAHSEGPASGIRFEILLPADEAGTAATGHAA